MVRNALKITVLALLVFVITNMVFPGIYNGTVLARVSHQLDSVGSRYNNYHLLIEANDGANDQIVLDSLRSQLYDHVFAFDITGEIISDQNILEARINQRLRSEPVRFVSYNPELLQPGNRMVKAVIFPKNRKSRLPIEFTAFSVNDNRDLVPLTQPAKMLLQLGETPEETSKRTAWLITLASLF